AFLIYTGFSASNGGHFSVYSTTFLPFFERKFDAYLRQICLFDAYLRRSGGFMCQMTRVSAAGPALRDRVPMPYGGVADGWETPDCAPVYRVQNLPAPHPRGSVIVYSDICKDLYAASGPRTPVRYGPE